MRRVVVPLVGVLALTGCARLPWRSRPAVYDATSDSMAPSIRAGDRVGCARRFPSVLRRGTVVAFRAEGAAEGKTFLKRVIGLPGETVASAGGAVTVDAVALDEPYAAIAPGGRTFGPVTVPEGTYFLMGDNRAFSADSRDHGPVAHDRVDAVCTRILAPAERRGRIAGT